MNGTPNNVSGWQISKAGCQIKSTIRTKEYGLSKSSTLALRSGFRDYFDDTPGLTPRAIKRIALRAQNAASLWLAIYLDKLGFLALNN